jgi:hypothetical protein
MTTTRSRCAIAALSLTLFRASAASLRARIRHPPAMAVSGSRALAPAPPGYVGKGNKCEALHQDTQRAYPYIPGTACPSGTFRSGDYCKEFR